MRVLCDRYPAYVRIYGVVGLERLCEAVGVPGKLACCRQDHGPASYGDHAALAGIFPRCHGWDTGWWRTQQ